MQSHIKIFIFGATGSIGQSCLRTMPTKATLVGFTYFNNQELANEIQINYPHAKSFNAQIHKDYESMIKECQPDLIVNALSGLNGFNVSLLAAKYHINLALANKETMVMAGWWLKKFYQQHNLFLSIIDSEHTSIEMLLSNQQQRDIKSIYLTCSGGPYYHLDEKTRNQLMCPENGLTHPTWKMGPKITFDCATLYNKAFEMIEAFYLFDIQSIYPIYHPQSIIHAMVKWKDETISMLTSAKSMDFATAYVLNNNQHPSIPFVNPLDLCHLSLLLEEIDPEKWLPIKLANEVIQNNRRDLGIIMVVLDDYLYELYVNKKINFGEIYTISAHFSQKYHAVIQTIDDVMEFYYFIQKEIETFIKQY